MAYEIVKIKREDVSKLDPGSFLDIERIEKDLLADTVVYVAFDGSAPVGIITLEPVGSIYRTSYFYVTREARRKGVGTELIDAVRSYDPKIYINDKMQGYETMLSAFVHMDIGEVRDVTEYTFSLNDETLGYFKKMRKEHGEPIMSRMKEHGFSVSTMTEATDELMEKLGEEMGEGFDEDENPENVKGLSKDCSYIVSKEGEPAAFIACVNEEDALRVEVLSAHKKCRGTGAAPLALFAIIDRVVDDDSINCVKAAVTDENDDIKKIVDDKLNGLITGKKQMKIFELK